MSEATLTGGGMTAPLAVRMRPRSLDEVVGQQHLLRPGSPLRTLAAPIPPGTQTPGAISVILWGPPGTGKTTLAQAIAHSSGRSFVELSAVTAGVKDVRVVMEKALNNRDLYGIATVLFLDEIHRFTKAQQDALLPGVENGWITLVAATTENPSFSVISPLLSRSLLLTLQQLTDADLTLLLTRAIADPRGLNGQLVVEESAIQQIVALASGDARRALTALEAAAASALAGGEPTVTEEIVGAAVDRALLRYDRNGDEHYDVISAFIKSVRGSDPDAALHYLARMIEAGEDPRFIARRIIVLAAEDIGLADPQALPIAVAAAEATQMIGLPEARIPLAEAVIYLATAPKSNAAYMAIDSAIADVRRGHFGRVPMHLRDGHYAGAKRLGHGQGYRYPHDEAVAVVKQQYLPDELRAQQYYFPTPHGSERPIGDRLEKIRRILRGIKAPAGQPPATPAPPTPSPTSQNPTSQNPTSQNPSTLNPGAQEAAPQPQVDQGPADAASAPRVAAPAAPKKRVARKAADASTATPAGKVAKASKEGQVVKKTKAAQRTNAAQETKAAQENKTVEAPGETKEAPASEAE